MTPALLLALASLAPAQIPSTEPAPAPAVAASTDAVPATVVGGVQMVGGVQVAGEVKPKLTRPIHATIHAEAKSWEPVSLQAGGDPGQAANGATLRQALVKGRWRGTASRAKASVRLHKAKNDAWLVVSVFPAALVKSRAHFELRFRIVEGYVEEATAALVAILDRRRGAEAMDSFEMRARGVEFSEDQPSSGRILVSALDPRPSRAAVNSGTLKRAAFPDANAGLGTVDVSWSVVGLPPAK